MRLFLISYDLAPSNRSKHAMAAAIMGLGQAWARPLESTWYVRAAVPQREIESRLSEMLEADDGLIVQAVSEDAALVNTSLRWFRQRRPAAEADSNVIAFPAGTLTAMPEPELPFARAG